jgi:hypothetical protein
MQKWEYSRLYTWLEGGLWEVTESDGTKWRAASAFNDETKGQSSEAIVPPGWYCRNADDEVVWFSDMVHVTEQAGGNGWELVSVVPGEHLDSAGKRTTAHWLYFKRPIEG